jgi:chromate transporter
MTKDVGLKEIAYVFLKLGLFGFGGPVAHIAMMREEVVKKKGWLSDPIFFDLVGATHLIPGPNSTELAIHIGHKLAGLRGLLIAGISFILPAFIIVLSFSWAYVTFGTLPALQPMLKGVRPAVVAIILVALWKFRESSIKEPKHALLSLIAFIAAVLGQSEVMIILAGGFIFCVFHNIFRGSLSIAPVLVFGSAAQLPISGSSIFMIFFKIGSVLFGSGYVLVSFLKSEFVDGRGWLTMDQLLDAITIGQATPGPVFTTATFVGYLLKGVEGASFATIGIFLPAFVFVMMSAPFITKIRNSQVFSSFLDGVNAASFGLMVLVSWELGTKGIFDLPTLLLACLSLLILLFTKLNSLWPIVAGALLGIIFFS